MLEVDLKEFGAGIAKLISKGNLNRAETKAMFDQLMVNTQPDLQQGAFLAALTAKGETAAEIAGAWEAIYEGDTVKVVPQTPEPVIENSGTGMDSFKTFNVSTAAAIIGAAGGNYMARHGARALTSSCGTIDVVEALGVDVECEVEVVKRSIECVGIGIFNGMSAKTHPQALFRILSQIRFGTTLNISASLANPAMPRRGVRGVYARDLVLPVVEVMKEIGYQKALVIHGSNGYGKGMDEISIFGETFIAELNGQNIHSYSITPEIFGSNGAEEAEVYPLGDSRAEAIRLIEILSGKRQGADYQMVCANAAPIFYVSGQSKNLKEGYGLSESIIRSGRALEKLREWVRAQNSDSRTALQKFESLVNTTQLSLTKY
ncbi:MAG: anthranilate phosphoribosyltransferase [Dehalogenimonas sp.]